VQRAAGSGSARSTIDGDRSGMVLHSPCPVGCMLDRVESKSCLLAPATYKDHEWAHGPDARILSSTSGSGPGAQVQNQTRRSGAQHHLRRSRVYSGSDPIPYVLRSCVIRRGGGAAAARRGAIDRRIPGSDNATVDGVSGSGQVAAPRW
jgi:hypothetical protein